MKSPILPPAMRDFSLITNPCMISAIGTLMRAKANIMLHESFPPINRNPRHKMAEAIAVNPTTDHIFEVSRSV